MFNVKNVRIGTLLDESNKKIIPSLNNIGDTVLPLPGFGRFCKKNAQGYSYPDKSKPKELRTIFTFSFFPYGNTNLIERQVDVEKMCYQRVVVPPAGIELVLIEENGNRYVVADLVQPTSDKIILAINMFVEIYGQCIVTDSDLKIPAGIKRLRCNWKMLPTGEWPSKHLDQYIYYHKDNINVKRYFQERLEFIESLSPQIAYSGDNGFADYVAYLFDDICVLECAEYANATYIVPKDEWETLSKLTKYELFNTHLLIERIPHNTKWELKIKTYCQK